MAACDVRIGGYVMALEGFVRPSILFFATCPGSSARPRRLRAIIHAHT